MNPHSIDDALRRDISDAMGGRYVVSTEDEKLLCATLVSPSARFSLLDEMYVELGSKDDWDRLAGFHYKAESLPAGPRYYRCVTASNDLVGICVMSSVALLLASRHDVFPKLKCGNDTKMTNTRRANFLNQNFCRAARIVTDTLYRGVGASYRMVNLAARMHGKQYCEIQSSMSKFNPFDVKAGFQHGHLRSANAYEKGVKFLRGYFDSHPADHQAIMEEYNRWPAGVQKRVLEEMALFYYRHSTLIKTGKNFFTGSGKRQIESMSASNMLREIQQLTFATPVYGVYKNPDVGRQLPPRLPLSAFDRQGVAEPLVILESDWDAI